MQAGELEKDRHAVQGRQHGRQQVGRHAIRARVATSGFQLHNWKREKGDSQPTVAAQLNIREGKKSLLLFHLNLRLLKLVDFLSNHLHFLELSSYYAIVALVGACGVETFDTSHSIRSRDTKLNQLCKKESRTLVFEFASAPRLILKLLAQLIQQFIQARVWGRNHPAMCVVHCV